MVNSLHPDLAYFFLRQNFWRCGEHLQRSCRIKLIHTAVAAVFILSWGLTKNKSNAIF